MHGQVTDPMFLKFLEKVAAETGYAVQTFDLVVLDAINRDLPIPSNVKGRIPTLLEHGVIERLPRKKHILSRKFYSFVGKPGEYTRKRGLGRKAEVALVLEHLSSGPSNGCPLNDFLELFPNLTKTQVQVLLRELKRTGKIEVRGIKRAARWHLVKDK